MLNIVTIQGRLVAAPELRLTQNGTSVCSFRVAVERNNSKEKKADFFTVQTWGHTADFVAKWFDKGYLIIADGELRTNEYTDKEGKKRTSVEILAHQVNFCGSKTQAPAEQTEPTEQINGLDVIAEDEDFPF